MASIAKHKNGTRRILFVALDGKRPTIRLGKKSLEFAREVKNKVEKLLEAKILKRAMPTELAEWVADLEPWLAKKLARVGLIPDHEATSESTLGEFLTTYIDGRTDLKPLTIRHLNDAKRNLIGFFGQQMPLSEITPGWGRRIPSRIVTSARRKHRAPIMWTGQTVIPRCRPQAIDPREPVADMKGCGVQANRARDHFVSRDDTAKLLDACPDSQWRLIVVLSRFSGLRCPSEHLALKWCDVNWGRDRIRISSPKTEHHAGGDSRTIPIFPELRPYLENAWDSAEPGTEFVITHYRHANANLRTQFQRIIRCAGFEPWPKHFQNLRASRATELAAEHPAYV